MYSSGYAVHNRQGVLVVPVLSHYVLDDIQQYATYRLCSLPSSHWPLLLFTPASAGMPAGMHGCRLLSSTQTGEA